MQDERNAGNFERQILAFPEHNPKQDDANQIIKARKKQEDYCARGEYVSGQSCDIQAIGHRHTSERGKRKSRDAHRCHGEG